MGDAILTAIKSAVFWLLLKIDSIVYTFIDWIYQIILMLADGDILGNTNLVDELMNRLYLIIGVIILFLVAYSLLRSMVNPDEALKGKDSPVKIVQNVIISVVLIAVVPYIFTFAMQFQSSLLQQNTIGRLILGEESSGNSSSETIDDGGFNIAINVFQAFFRPNTDAGFCTGNNSIDQNYPDCQKLMIDIGDYDNYEDWWENDVYGDRNFGAISDAAEYVATDQISYTWIISTLAGAYVVYVLALYCIEIAIRLVKLAVFQLIAPLPILARIIPKEDTKKIFSNWLKATISTYVEVFIRLAMLFFAVLIIKIVTDNFLTIFGTIGENWGNVNPVLVLIAQALVILGIVMFVRQLPQIIKDITGLDSGKYGKALIKGAGMLATSLGGGATAAIRRAAADKREHPGMGRGQRAARALGALTGGMRRGLWQGSKIDKFGDIPKAAGRTASNTLGYGALIDAAGGGLAGRKKYYVQKGKDKLGLVSDWVGGSADAIKAEKATNDKLLKVIGSVKATAEDYIDKHAHEYFAFSNAADATAYEQLMATAKQAKASGNQARIAAAERAIENFKTAHASERLDVLKATYDYAKTHGTAEQVAEAERAYQSARKATVDGFATSVHTHYGAEKEAALVSEDIKTMQQLIGENSASTAVKYLVEGSVEHGLTANRSQLTEATAAKYFKDVKNAAEFANSDIQATLNEIERREERRKAANPKGGKDK